MVTSYQKCPGVIVGFDGARDLQVLASKEYEGTKTGKNEAENDEYLVDNVELEKVEFSFDHKKDNNNETSPVDVPGQKFKKVLVKSPPACEIEIVSPKSFASIRRKGQKMEAMAPIHADPKMPKNKIKICKDTMSFAAMQHHQNNINEKIRILQRSVPGGTEFCRDKAAMLEEVINYIKFLEDRVQLLEQCVGSRPSVAPSDNGGYIDDEETRERMDMLWELMNEKSKDGCEGKMPVKGSSSLSGPVRRWLLRCTRGRYYSSSQVIESLGRHCMYLNGKKSLMETFKVLRKLLLLQKSNHGKKVL